MNSIYYLYDFRQIIVSFRTLFSSSKIGKAMSVVVKSLKVWSPDPNAF